MKKSVKMMKLYSFIFQNSNFRPHNNKYSDYFFKENSIEKLPNPPYLLNFNRKPMGTHKFKYY